MVSAAARLGRCQAGELCDNQPTLRSYGLIPTPHTQGYLEEDWFDCISVLLLLPKGPMTIATAAPTHDGSFSAVSASSSWRTSWSPCPPPWGWRAGWPASWLSHYRYHRPYVCVDTDFTVGQLLLSSLPPTAPGSRPALCMAQRRECVGSRSINWSR